MTRDLVSFEKVFHWTKFLAFNPLSRNPTKWSNTLKQFAGKRRRIVSVLFDHFVGLALKWLKAKNVFHWNVSWKLKKQFSRNLMLR